VAVGDFNGDGKQDLVTANWDSNNVSILLRDCALTLAQISNVIILINDSALIPASIKTSLNAKLQAALAALQVGDTAITCSKLQDFLNALRAQRGKKIPVDLADGLTASVIQIRAEVGCGGVASANVKHLACDSSVAVQRTDLPTDGATGSIW